MSSGVAERPLLPARLPSECRDAEVARKDVRMGLRITLSTS
jgi:hypothetical protein